MSNTHRTPKSDVLERFAAHGTLDTAPTDGRLPHRTGFASPQGVEALGWPAWFASVADTISDGMHKPDAKQFSMDLLAAVPDNADLAPAREAFLVALNQRALDRLRGCDDPYAKRCRAAIQEVIEWLEAGSVQPAPQAASLLAQSAPQSGVQLAGARLAAEAAAHSTSDSDDAAKLAACAAAESAAWCAQWSTVTMATQMMRMARVAEYRAQCGSLLAVVGALGGGGSGPIKPNAQ